MWVIAYTKQLRAPMMFYTAAINGVFAALIAGALIFTQGGVTKDFLLDLMFYVGQIRIPLKIGRESLNESEPA